MTLSLDLAQDLPTLMADRTQLQQVIVNLAVNAAQAMGQAQGTRRLAISSRRDGESLIVCVDDNGPGISPDAMPQLFDSFFTTKDGGMGMGLPICRSIIEAHGGTISVRNRDEGGASFAVSLPAL